MGEPRNGPVQQALEAISGTLSVPQVFVNGEFMGDNSAIQVTRGARKKRMERDDGGRHRGKRWCACVVREGMGGGAPLAF